MDAAITDQAASSLRAKRSNPGVAAPHGPWIAASAFGLLAMTINQAHTSPRGLEFFEVSYPLRFCQSRRFSSFSGRRAQSARGTGARRVLAPPLVRDGARVRNRSVKVS